MTYEQFCDIYLPLTDGFYRVAYYILESEQDARDAVQDLFIKLWNSRDTLDSVHNPMGYGIRLLKNLCIDRIRKESRLARADLSEEIPADDTADGPQAAKEQAERLMRAVRKLPERQRAVLEMKLLRGMSNEQISKETGMSNLAVRVMISRARTKIKEAL
ncbi:MAG: sigma-70 family RNA polymerase sigma factor [Bacteroidales bacterium]|jgi:RNA polymerase sigma-70 factor (ECF subfamily)|nr:sigma-70 family RNA polymerase sigma factor [Bacteroidales bacterium]